MLIAAYGLIRPHAFNLNLQASQRLEAVIGAPGHAVVGAIELRAGVRTTHFALDQRIDETLESIDLQRQRLGHPVKHEVARDIDRRVAVETNGNYLEPRDLHITVI